MISSVPVQFAHGHATTPFPEPICVCQVTLLSQSPLCQSCASSAWQPAVTLHWLMRQGLYGPWDTTTHSKPAYSHVQAHDQATPSLLACVLHPGIIMSPSTHVTETGTCMPTHSRFCMLCHATIHPYTNTHLLSPCCPSLPPCQWWWWSWLPSYGGLRPAGQTRGKAPSTSGRGAGGQGSGAGEHAGINWGGGARQCSGYWNLELMICGLLVAFVNVVITQNTLHVDMPDVFAFRPSLVATIPWP